MLVTQDMKVALREFQASASRGATAAAGIPCAAHLHALSFIEHLYDIMGEPAYRITEAGEAFLEKSNV